MGEPPGSGLKKATRFRSGEKMGKENGEMAMLPTGAASLPSVGIFQMDTCTGWVSSVNVPGSATSMWLLSFAQEGQAKKVKSWVAGSGLGPPARCAGCCRPGWPGRYGRV